MLEGGWHFVPADSPNTASVSDHSDSSWPSSTPDKLYGSKMLSDLYYKASPDYSARFTVPVIWDTKTETIVNNESSEVIRFLNTGFNELLPEGKEKEREMDLYPQDLRKEIDELNEWVYNDVNNGVYKSGFASKQQAYEDAVKQLQKSMKRLDELLSDGREFLVGGKLTEADVRYVLYTAGQRLLDETTDWIACSLRSCGMILYTSGTSSATSAPVRLLSL
jgi:putative glutathione S-transferase